MDAQLAEIYGTGNYESQETDIEKMAAAELLVKLAEEEGVDLEAFNDQEIAEMVNGLYKQAAETEEEEKKEEAKAKQSAFGKEHEEKESKEHEEKEEKSEEKVAEADFLGRVMAHSMVHELREIEKQASDPFEHLGDESASHAEAAGKKGVSKVKHTLGKGKDAIVGAAKKSWEFAKAHPKASIGTGVGAAAALGGGLALRHHLKKKKEASALETLAQKAAFEMAKQAGYIDEEGNFLVEAQPQEKQASALDQAVYARALEICEANGIPVEWNE